MTRFNMNAKVLLASIVVLLSLSLGRVANGATGVVSGSFALWNKNGNYCDPGVHDCTGTSYPKTDFDKQVPFKDARVEVWQGTKAIGIGSSNASGNFTVSWTSSVLTNAWVRIFAQNKDNRWFIGDTAGLRQNTNTPTFTLTAGTTSANPQPVGSYVDATSNTGAPWYDNVYWAAWLQWNNSFAYVGSLVTNYTNIEVRGVASAIPSFLGTCKSSCADGSSKRLQLDSTVSAFSPQGRILHESGHIVQYLMKPFHGDALNYCWDQNGSTSPVPPATTCPWSTGEKAPEWAYAAFLEGYATFIGDTTLWWPNAVEPTSCLSQFTCPVTDDTRIEKSDFPYSKFMCDTSAATPEIRWPMSTMRTLWDIYDDHNDADGDTVVEGWGNYSRFFTNLQNYPAGVADHQLDEPWSNTSYNVIDDSDGKGCYDYVYWYTLSYLNVDILWNDNCSPL